MNATQQFYELVAAEFSRIEQLKAQALERGDIICNITDAFMRGEISQVDYDDLIARTCGDGEVLA